ncbi:hypothetical protein OZD61_05335 [Wolbachia endosymbiont of Drosophila bocki]|nr:hypothetical protein [Wolbachia endosymbiont of Drosophila bocki]
MSFPSFLSYYEDFKQVLMSLVMLHDRRKDYPNLQALIMSLMFH